MASEKQVRLMLARANSANIKVDKASLEKMSNGDIDAFLVKCEDAKTDTKVEDDNDFNNARFGMVYKLVWSRYTNSQLINYEEQFFEDVRFEYKRATDAAEFCQKQPVRVVSSKGV